MWPLRDVLCVPHSRLSHCGYVSDRNRLNLKKMRGATLSVCIAMGASSAGVCLGRSGSTVRNLSDDSPSKRPWEAPVRRCACKYDTRCRATQRLDASPRRAITSNIDIAENPKDNRQFLGGMARAGNPDALMLFKA
ncbi:hypothetical protein PYCCODRAFT_772195 [Trametes coccinea BRFM310]|uniref:K Homology domain-containing protein n=1 Tax=Trametes coccinea (strain BRFM310) TaxID=1353009 RepID=A0A1Y2J0I8_TRAC3|nr:hypothetical protein PYCCODRAFT_772195 [Trametes coccinea BRFM310]